ncbi:MAG: 2-hydroxyacyl-CoA dehydratase subunit D [Candidatus Hodarchaeota archaeon]
MTEQSASQNSGIERIRVKNLPSMKMLKDLIINYGLKSKMAAKNPFKKTAWVAAGFPVELCYMYDIQPLHPENSACVSGARKISQDLIEYAESLGFSRDLCSYFKTNVGAVGKKIGLKKGGIDKPTFMGSTNTICDTHVKWFQTQARKMKVPYFAFDIPSAVDSIDEDRLSEYEDYVIAQYEDFYVFMKDLTGKDVNEKKFMEVLKKSDRLCELWQEIYNYRKLLPTPVAFQDTLAAIFPLVVLPGIDTGIKFYEALLKDVKDRVANNEAAMPDGKERFRILFEGIPMWYRLKFFHELANYGAVVTYEPYTLSFGPRKKLDGTTEENMRQLARLLLLPPYSLSIERRIKYFEEVIDEYKIDGIILHSNMSCRPSCTGMIELKNAIQKDKGIPVWLMDCDMNDPRAFSEEQMKTRMESFVELLEQNKK